MTKVVFRHLFGEALRTWLIITAVLVVLTLGIGLSSDIGKAAAGELPVHLVAKLAVLSIVGSLEIVLPFSVLLAVMLVVGRLCRDNEMAALMAGGVGPTLLYRPFLALAVLVAVLAGVMSLVVAPIAQQKINRLSASSAVNALQAVTPGRFASFEDGRVSFYAKSRDDQGHLHQVFVRVLKKEKGKTKQIVITAATARESVDAQHALTLVLEDGWRYDGIPGHADYRIIRFQEHGILLQPGNAADADDVKARSTAALLGSDDNEAIAAWQTRFSVPISILILALIALPLGRVPPHAGRYGRIIAGILFFVIYLDMVQLAGQAVESGLLAPAIGEWWVHAFVLGIAALLIARENGWLMRRWNRRGGTS
jgi:lipopolysaccharide export system permease protein